MLAAVWVPQLRDICECIFEISILSLCGFRVSVVCLYLFTVCVFSHQYRKFKPSMGHRNRCVCNYMWAKGQQVRKIYLVLGVIRERGDNGAEKQYNFTKRVPLVGTYEGLYLSRKLATLCIVFNPNVRGQFQMKCRVVLHVVKSPEMKLSLWK